jgi:hypothetical protein
LRTWLDKDEVPRDLLEDEMFCLLLNERMKKATEHLGRRCFPGLAFPLSLAILLTVLFEGHPLMGHNQKPSSYR